jgi:hypothetical protein
MTFRHFISAVIVAAASFPVVAGAQTQGQGKPPEQKPTPAGEKPAAVNVAGKMDRSRLTFRASSERQSST